MRLTTEMMSKEKKSHYERGSDKVVHGGFRFRLRYVYLNYNLKYDHFYNDLCQPSDSCQFKPPTIIASAMFSSRSNFFLSFT